MQAIAFASKFGAQPSLVHDAVQRGMGNSFVFKNWLPLMMNDDFHTMGSSGAAATPTRAAASVVCGVPLPGHRWMRLQRGFPRSGVSAAAAWRGRALRFHVVRCATQVWRA